VHLLITVVNLPLFNPEVKTNPLWNPPSPIPHSAFRNPQS
jgi:hypothetical protein